MDVRNLDHRKDTKIESYPYRGKPLEVRGVYIRWLSKAGPDGAPEYGLRYFTIEPGGEIPIHNHVYYQTMYILSGRLLAMSHDPETDAVVDQKEAGPSDFVYVPTMEPHSIRNLSDTEAATFLCCIGNVCAADTM